MDAELVTFLWTAGKCFAISYVRISINELRQFLEFDLFLGNEIRFHTDTF